MLCLLLSNPLTLPPSQVGHDYEKELGDISKSCSLVGAENITAYTYISAADQYSAYVGKTRRGNM